MLHGIEAKSRPLKRASYTNSDIKRLPLWLSTRYVSRTLMSKPRVEGQVGNISVEIASPTLMLEIDGLNTSVGIASPTHMLELE